MKRSVRLVGALLLLSFAACGRGTHNPKPDALASVAGVPSTDETPDQAGNAAGQGGSAAELPPGCEGVPYYCMPSCMPSDLLLAECVDSQYRCPAGTVTLDDCPEDACVRRTRSCCSPNGQSEFPDCATDGTIGECPAGYAATTGTCLPAGVDIESCADLETGMACTDPELVCFTSKCGRNCSCIADENGKLAWECHALPC